MKLFDVLTGDLTIEARLEKSARNINKISENTRNRKIRVVNRNGLVTTMLYESSIDPFEQRVKFER